MEKISISDLNKKKVSNQQTFIDKLIYNNISDDSVIESINKLRILILINFFGFEKLEKYSRIKLSLLFLQSKDLEQNEIYNWFETVLWSIKQTKCLKKTNIKMCHIYKAFDFVEGKYMAYLKNKNKKILSDNLYLFFIGGYPK